MNRPGSRPLSTILLVLVLLAAGALLLWMGMQKQASVAGRQPEQPFQPAGAGGDESRPGPPPGKGGPPEGGPRGAGRNLSEHPEELKLPPAKGRTLWVYGGAAAGGDGSEARPWKDLQAALRQLRAGDRLVVKIGKYVGPFSIDESCADAPPDNPIEVHTKVDAVLRASGDAPVLTVKRRGWTFHGLDIEPGRGGGPALVIDGGKDLRFSHGHFHDGWGDGVWIQPGSERVTFETTHIHIFGPRGGPPAGRRTVIGVRVAPGTSGIAFVGSNLHNIGGPPVKVLTPSEFGDTKLVPAAEVRMQQTTVVENWPETD